MARYVFIPGAGGIAYYWHRVTALLETAGHEAIAVDLPARDERAGLREYTECVLAAIDGKHHTILVAQSFGGFTAAMASSRTRVGGLIFVNAMIPRPGETFGDWGDAVHSRKARIAKAKRDGYSEEFDDATYFLHDIPADVVKELAKHEHDQSDTPFGEPCDFKKWPEIPIRSLAGADDRLFPVELQQQIARDRLGIEAEVIPGGHLVALSRPAELVAAITAPLPNASSSPATAS
jgi:pimeloyl-ACP methyl ester carboxylesterase